jgi:hypothetical protein
LFIANKRKRAGGSMQDMETIILLPQQTRILTHCCFFVVPLKSPRCCAATNVVTKNFNQGEKDGYYFL